MRIAVFSSSSPARPRWRSRVKAWNPCGTFHRVSITTAHVGGFPEAVLSEDVQYNSQLCIKNDIIDHYPVTRSTPRCHRRPQSHARNTVIELERLRRLRPGRRCIAIKSHTHHHTQPPRLFNPRYSSAHGGRIFTQRSYRRVAPRFPNGRNGRVLPSGDGRARSS